MMADRPLTVLWANGDADIDMFQIRPGSSVMFLSRNEDVFWVKEADAAGNQVKRKFRFEEVVEPRPADLIEERMDSFESRLDAVMERLGMGDAEQPSEPQAD